MKKLAKRLSLTTQTIRVLQSNDLSQVQGGTGSLSGGTSVISASGPSVIRPTTGQSGPSVIQPSTTSVISAGGGH